MPVGDQQGRFTYSVRVSRPDGMVLQEIPFDDLREALQHFHGMVREAPQPRVYVQLCQHAGKNSKSSKRVLSRPGQCRQLVR